MATSSIEAGTKASREVHTGQSLGPYSTRMQSGYNNQEARQVPALNIDYDENASLPFWASEDKQPSETQQHYSNQVLDSPKNTRSDSYGNALQALLSLSTITDATSFSVGDISSTPGSDVTREPQTGSYSGKESENIGASSSNLRFEAPTRSDFSPQSRSSLLSYDGNKPSERMLELLTHYRYFVAPWVRFRVRVGVC